MYQNLELQGNKKSQVNSKKRLYTEGFKGRLAKSNMKEYHNWLQDELQKEHCLRNICTVFDKNNYLLDKKIKSLFLF